MEAGRMNLTMVMSVAMMIALMCWEVRGSEVVVRPLKLNEWSTNHFALPKQKQANSTTLVFSFNVAAVTDADDVYLHIKRRSVFFHPASAVNFYQVSSLSSLQAAADDEEEDTAEKNTYSLEVEVDQCSKTTKECYVVVRGNDEGFLFDIIYLGTSRYSSQECPFSSKVSHTAVDCNGYGACVSSSCQCDPAVLSYNPVTSCTPGTRANNAELMFGLFTYLMGVMVVVGGASVAIIISPLYPMILAKVESLRSKPSWVPLTTPPQ